MFMQSTKITIKAHTRPKPMVVERSIFDIPVSTETRDIVRKLVQSRKRVKG